MTRPRKPQAALPQRSRGAILLGILVLMLLAGMGLATYTQSWAAARQRDKEEELLFIGRQFQQALESYYLSSPGPAKHLPVKLDELVKDSRFPQPVRHLRKLYTDPFEPDTPWGVIRRGPQIIGVYSQANGEPFRRADFDRGLESFTGATSYAQWQFVFVPRLTPTPSLPTRRDNPSTP